MADSRIQMKVEAWIREQWLPMQFGGMSFEARRMRLRWGGEFEFDVASSDGSVVGLVSTSAARTARKKLSTGAVHKIKSDTLYLLNVEGVQRRLLIFTECSMRDEFERASRRGRFPPAGDIQLLAIGDALPSELAATLISARNKASAEMFPQSTAVQP